jgi:hypothetical protein
MNVLIAWFGIAALTMAIGSGLGLLVLRLTFVAMDGKWILVERKKAREHAQGKNET